MQTDEEVRQKVLIRVLPLNWIYFDTQKGTTSQLFNLLRQNLQKLNDTLLLDVIFEAFWKEQQLLILRYCFFPYCIFFTVGQLYYLDVMLQNVVEFDAGSEKIFECGIIIPDSVSCETWETYELIMRVLFLILII